MAPRAVTKFSHLKYVQSMKFAQIYISERILPSRDSKRHFDDAFCNYYLLFFQDFWYRHFCFVNMGRHYFNLNYDVEAPCEPNNIPVQLLYSGDVLNGFVWQHVSAIPGFFSWNCRLISRKKLYLQCFFIPGDQWESVSSFALGQIVDRPPNCLYDLVENPGVTTMHIYFRNYETLCITDKHVWTQLPMYNVHNKYNNLY